MAGADLAHVTVVLADGEVVYLSDGDARRLADALWDAGGAASVAVAIRTELRRRGRLRQTIDVPKPASAAVSRAIVALGSEDASRRV